VYPEKVSSTSRKSGSAKERWWQFKRPAPNLREAVAGLEHVIVVPVVSPNFIVHRIKNDIVVGNKLKVIALDGWYHFAILQSAMHEYWAWARGATLKGDLSYTNTTVFETYPFPAKSADGYDPRKVPKSKEATALAKAGQAFYEKRAAACIAMNVGLTKVHNFIKGKSPLTDLAEPHQAMMRELIQLYEAMNAALCACYGWPEEAWQRESEVLGRLLELNRALAGK
jgi:hypothetical protein